MELKSNQLRQSAESGHIRIWLVGVLALAVLGYLWLRHHEPPLDNSKPPLVRHQLHRSPSSTSPQLQPSLPLPMTPNGATVPERQVISPPAPPSGESSSTSSPSAPPAAGAPPTTTVSTPPSLPPPPVLPLTNSPSTNPSSPFPSTTSNSVENVLPPSTTHSPAQPASRPRRTSRGEDPEWLKGYSQAVLEYQVALAKRGFFSGSLDGKLGSQSRAAVRAFQEQNNLPPTGLLTQDTRDLLILEAPLFTSYTITAADVARLRPLASTWLGKSQQDRLDYETILELVSESFMAHPALIQRLNPSVNWNRVDAGTSLQVPHVDKTPWKKKAGSIHIQLSKRCLQVYDMDGKLMQHMPCSIGHIAEKRPIGNLKVQVIAPNPNYTFNPAVFPESEEARQLGRKLRIEPGPNNPVGTAWIGLDRPGYGIHGTPQPEQVGRTESHGCFRLANWNAEQLARMVWVGLPITVDP